MSIFWSIFALVAISSAHEFRDDVGKTTEQITRKVWIHNSNPGEITTIIDCQSDRNKNQPDRTVDPAIPCESLQQIARQVATGNRVCNNGLGGYPRPSNFTGCQYNGQVVKVPMNGPPGSFVQLPGGQCERGAQEGYTIRSTYIEEIIGDYRVIATNGIPNHNYMQYTPNTPCETYRIQVTQKNRPNPEAGSYKQTPMGAIGIAKSGAFLFNYVDDEAVCRVAALAEAHSFGPCRGHAQINGFWHYHSPSTCLTKSAEAVKNASDPDPCVVIGYTVDGFPVRNKCQNRNACYRLKPNVDMFNCTAEETRNGHIMKNVTVYPGCDSDDYEYYAAKENCNLDEANGYVNNGQYTYYLSDYEGSDVTQGFPFILPKWHYQGNEGYFCTLENLNS